MVFLNTSMQNLKLYYAKNFFFDLQTHLKSSRERNNTSRKQ